MKKNKSIILGIVISLAVGYIAGGVIGIPGVDPSLLNGDISKVNKYNKQVSEEVKAFQERMENDSTFREETLASLAVVDTRVNQFKDLTDSTAIAAKGIKDLEQTVAQINDMKEFAKGAQLQADSAFVVLCNMANGTKEIGADYEQLANNTFIAYSLMDRQRDVARAFVEQADKYLYNNSKNEALTKIRDKWVAFCGDGAILDGNKQEQAYWNKKCVMPNLANSQPRQIQGIVFNRVALNVKASRYMKLDSRYFYHAKALLMNHSIDAAKLGFAQNVKLQFNTNEKLAGKILGGSGNILCNSMSSALKKTINRLDNTAGSKEGQPFDPDPEF